MNNLVTIDDIVVRIDAHGRYCLNDLHKAAIANGKATESHAPAQFLKTDKVQAFIAALDAEDQCEENHIAQKVSDATKIASVHSVKGGKNPGTYAVELVAIRYAAWIDPFFEVRVYRTFQRAAKGNDDWKRLRHSAASGYKVVSGVLKLTRESQGKDTQTHHYSNEARLINWALSGKFEGVDRDSLSTQQLDLLAHLQEKNAVLICCKIPYEQRKPMLKQIAMDWDTPRLMAA